ncbi:MAG: 5'/3'-nucleotidase SurE [Desulfobacterales bacterium]|nr:5'/3'-nucleotidase SurE [Desulfobacterales bacterium]
MKILITNDDGHEEPGLEALYQAVKPLGDVAIVAPEAPQSGVGHSITLKGGIYAKKIKNYKYSVQGFPVDCVRLGLQVLAPDAEWVISGINPGANLGTDVYPSGTMAAAREASILGRKAIAVSQYIAEGCAIDWAATGYHVSKILPVIMGKDLSPGQYWNINMPHPLYLGSELEYQFCRLEKRPYDYIFLNNSDRYHYTGSIHDRPRAAGTDVAVCYSGQIAVTLMEL